MHQIFCEQLGIIASLYLTGLFEVFYDALLSYKN